MACNTVCLRLLCVKSSRQMKCHVYLWFILLKNYNIDLVSSECTGQGVVLAIFLRFLSNIFKKQSRNLCFTPLLFCMNHNDLPTK